MKLGASTIAIERYLEAAEGRQWGPFDTGLVVEAVKQYGREIEAAKEQLREAVRNETT